MNKAEYLYYSYCLIDPSAIGITFIYDTRTLINVSLFKYLYFKMNKCTIPSITIFTRPCDVIKDTHQHKNCFDAQVLMLMLSLKLFDNESAIKKIRGS